LKGDGGGGGFEEEVGLAGGDGAAGAVEGADILADVAADEIAGLAHRLVEVFVNGRAVFEGEVADAFGGIEAVGGKGLGGAGVEAAAAGATVIGDRGIGFEIKGEDEFTDQKPRAVTGVDEEGVFADPAEAGGGGEVTFEDGAGVAVGADFEFVCGGRGRKGIADPMFEAF
jgi:hypothetical protein